MCCPICKQEIKENSKFCSKCGNVVPRCPSCGKVIDKKSSFCIYDGTPLPEELTALLPKEHSQEQGVMKRKRKAWQFVLLLIVALLLTGVLLGGYFLYENGKIDLGGNKENTLKAESSVEVTEQGENGTDAIKEDIEVVEEAKTPEINEIEPEEILEKIQEVSEITKAVYGAYSEYLDEQDVIYGTYFGTQIEVENWPFKCVIYPGVNSIQDFEELLKSYYTDNVVADFLAIVQYVEQNGKLYIAEADGLGGLDVDEYKVHIIHDIYEIYEIEIVAKYVGKEVDEIPEEVNYRLTEKGWRFDQGIVFWSDSPITLEGEEEDIIKVSETTVKWIGASSYLNEANYNIEHLPKFAMDGDLKTAWVEGKDDYGLGETIVFEFEEKCQLSGLTIYAGYQKTVSLYEKNSRPEVLRITFSDGNTEELTLQDVMGKQTLLFETPKVTKSVIVTISDVYEGNTYADTSISEISFF